jgi:DNA-binding response OmpR family regulator
MQDGKHVILCIDDDEDILMVLKANIEGAGYVYAQATSAEEGLKVYKEVQPDFVIVDLMMEEVDAGTNFVKELKLLGKTPPIYMLSSMGDDLHQMTDYSDLGLNGVLQKPVRKDKLLSLLEAKLK